jgi:hypothetical protein
MPWALKQKSKWIVSASKTRKKCYETQPRYNPVSFLNKMNSRLGTGIGNNGKDICIILDICNHLKRILIGSTNKGWKFQNETYKI